MSARTVRCTSLLVLPGVLAALATASAPGTPARAALPSPSLLKQGQVTFVQNRGQVNGPVRYYVPGRDRSVYFTPTGLTYSLHTSNPGAAPAPRAKVAAPARRYALKLDFVGASAPRISGESRQAGTVNYLSGPAAARRARVPTYAGLRYAGLWPGIDLVYQGSSTGLKYEYRLAPGADPAAVRLAYRGAESLRISDTGDLIASTPAGEVHDPRPFVYQEIDGRRVEVSSAYELHQSTGGSAEYGFRVGRYDRTRPLVIDPALLLNAGYIGGALGDIAAAVAVDEEGASYVAGYTFSTQATFPEVAGFDSTYDGAGDAYIAKLLPDGSGFAYCTYLGGEGLDTATCIAVDGLGRAYVGGRTDSSVATFPAVFGPDLVSIDTDGWVGRLSADGATLEYCGYVGGVGEDTVQAVAVDDTGRAYVVGSTEATQDTFPVSIGPDLTANGRSDAYVARITPNGDTFEYCGFIGGADEDGLYGVAVRADGSAFVTGDTRSTETTFPASVGPDLTYNGSPADQDAFVAQVTPSGSGLAYCGYVGGNSQDTGRAIAVDGSGGAYITGTTRSGPSTFPVLTGPSLAPAGGLDAYVARILPGGTGLDYCGYLGGAGDEEAFGLALDEDRNLYLGGVTSSDQRSFPVVAGPDITYQGGFQDGWVARVHAGATAIEYCGYLGGSGTDFVAGVAVDGLGRLAVAGATSSPPSSFPARGGLASEFNGGSTAALADAFAAQIGALTAPDPSAGNLSVPRKLNGGSVKVGKSHAIKLQLKNRGRGPVTLNLSAPMGPFTLSETGDITLSARRSRTVTVTFAPAAKGTFVSGLAITSTDPSAPLTVVPLSGRGK